MAAAPRRLLGEVVLKSPSGAGRAAPAAARSAPSRGKSRSVTHQEESPVFLHNWWVGWWVFLKNRRIGPAIKDPSCDTFYSSCFLLHFSDTRCLKQLLFRVIFMLYSFQAPGGKRTIISVSEFTLFLLIV